MKICGPAWCPERSLQPRCVNQVGARSTIIMRYNRILIVRLVHHISKRVAQEFSSDLRKRRGVERTKVLKVVPHAVGPERAKNCAWYDALRGRVVLPASTPGRYRPVDGGLASANEVSRVFHAEVSTRALADRGFTSCMDPKSTPLSPAQSITYRLVINPVVVRWTDGRSVPHIGSAGRLDPGLIHSLIFPGFASATLEILGSMLLR